MRKMILLFFALAAALTLAGCENTESSQPLAVYSFHGENELLAIHNGVIVIRDGEEVFDGGDLEVQEDFPSEITSYTAEFYYLSGNNEKTILTHSVVDQTGNHISVEGDLGRISGDGAISGLGAHEQELADLQNGLFFELTTTDQSGAQNVYQVQMSLSEVLSESEN